MTIDDLIARMAIGDFIQTAAVLVAVGASLVALFTSWRDRVSARKIAAEDRRASLEQAKLMFDLEALLRLQQNHNRGGSTDALERTQMGAEAMAIVGLLGPTVLPNLWQRRIGKSDDDLAAQVADEETEEWKKWQFETQIALNRTTARIRELVERD